MNNSTRTITTLVGIYAGILGMAHGYFSVIQGHAQPDGVMFNAIGSPCQAESIC